MTTNVKLITEVRNLLNDPISSPAPYFQDETILQYIQRATDDLCIETDCNYRAYSYTAVASATSATFVTLTGSAENKLFRLTDLSVKASSDTTYREIKRVAYTSNLQISDNNDSDIISVHIYDDTIYPNAKINIGDTILISGRWKKADLVNPGTFPLDSMAEDAVVKYATAMGFFTMTKMEVGQIWFTLYEQRKEVIKKYYENLIKSKDPGAVRVHKKSNSLGITVDDYGVITA